MTEKHSSSDLLAEISKVIRQFMRRADEAQDLFNRSRQAFPVSHHPGIRKHNAELERRFKDGDKGVIATYDMDEKVVDYSPCLTPDEERRLIERYLKERTAWGDYFSDADRKQEATIFAETIAGEGFSIPIFEELVPPSQKDRQRNLESVANAFDKLVDSLNKIDSAALGWLFAVMEESAAKSGLSIAPLESDGPNPKNRPFQAMVEGGEVRQAIKRIHEAVGLAIREAGKSLPKVERDENDPRLHAAFSLERLFQEHQLLFETTETSFAAECLRTMFELGGRDTDRVSYWLKKVADTPSDQVPWFGAIRKSAG